MSFSWGKRQVSVWSGAEGEVSTDSPLWLPSVAGGGSALGSRC